MALFVTSIILLPLVEIALFILVGKAIGLGATLALVVLAAIAWLIHVLRPAPRPLSVG